MFQTIDKIKHKQVEKEVRKLNLTSSQQTFCLIRKKQLKYWKLESGLHFDFGSG
jgi:hypothetical protein